MSHPFVPHETPIVVCTQDAVRLQRVIMGAAGTRQEDDADALEAELARAVVVPAAELPSDVVIMESVVVFADEASATQREITLAYPEDADAGAGRISVLAPIGAALLGLRVGQRIEWPTPLGRTVVRVIGVEQPSG